MEIDNSLIFSGDEFALRDGGSLFCKEDHDHLGKTNQTSSIEHNNNNAFLNNNNNTNSSNNQTRIGNNNHSSEMGSMSGEIFMHIFSVMDVAKFFQIHVGVIFLWSYIL